MKKLFIATMVLMVSGTASFAQSVASVNMHQVVMHKSTTVNNENNEVFNDLMQGNKRFIKDRLEHPHQDISYALNLSKSQHPKAVVITCADSRVSPEILFDQGLGDLFVIRNAGNVIDDDVLGSIEYAIEHLDVKTIVVLGHENCGAVTATVNHLKTNNHIMALEKAIVPAYKVAEKQTGDKIHNTVVQNVVLSINRIEKDKTLLPANMQPKDVNIYGAVYDMGTGVVTPVHL
jgi:carbonic anhydrase